jgi:hypothetical protein
MAGGVPKAASSNNSIGRTGRALGSNMLTGALPPELARLSHLVALCARPPAARWDVAAAPRPPATRNAALRSGLASNGFLGSLASWFGSLMKLTRLYAPVTAERAARGHWRILQNSAWLHRHCCSTAALRIHTAECTHTRARAHTYTHTSCASLLTNVYAPGRASVRRRVCVCVQRICSYIRYICTF